MNQPPENNFYSDSTEGKDNPQQQWPGQAPGYPWRSQAAPGNYAPQEPNSQPGFPPAQQGFPPQRPGNPSGMAQQNYPQQHFAGNPGMTPQGFAPSQEPGGLNQQRPPLRSSAAQELRDPFSPDQARQRPSYPPPSGPISLPGFSAANTPQRDLYATEQAPSSIQPAPGGMAVPPWSQPLPPEPPPHLAPWQQSEQQQQQQPPWLRQQQPAQPASWPNLAPPPPPPATTRKKSRLGLVITLVLIVLIVAGGTGGFFLWRAHGSAAPAGGLTTHGTPVTSGVTPVPSRTGSGTPAPGATGIGTPVQAGTSWIVTITSIKETTSSLIAPNTGNIYLEINLKLKNISGKTLTLLSLIEFNLSGPNGQRWHETLGDTNIRRTPDGNVSANSTLLAQLAYEVPKAQHAFILVFAYGLNDNNSNNISWKFTA